MAITSISAITLATRDMSSAVQFYQKLGFEVHYGSERASFTSLHAGSQSYLNLMHVQGVQPWNWWGRIIFHVEDVDALYGQAVQAGLSPQAPPRDAEWGERYFHITDPDGHELSFARPLA